MYACVCVYIVSLQIYMYIYCQIYLYIISVYIPSNIFIYTLFISVYLLLAYKSLCKKRSLPMTKNLKHYLFQSLLVIGHCASVSSFTDSIIYSYVVICLLSPGNKST